MHVDIFAIDKYRRDKSTISRAFGLLRLDRLHHVFYR